MFSFVYLFVFVPVGGFSFADDSSREYFFASVLGRGFSFAGGSVRGFHLAFVPVRGFWRRVQRPHLQLRRQQRLSKRSMMKMDQDGSSA